MREGQNPAKMGLQAYRPKQLGLAILSYIPSQDGYFADSLDVLRYQIASIHYSTKEFDLLVFDNGSCKEVQEELHHLQEKGFIHFLILSKYNLGKTGALNWILSALPNPYIGFSDGDVLFRPGWLEKSLEILQAFPAAGLISVQPCLFDILRSEAQAQHALEDDPRYHLTTRILDALVVEEYGHGIGLNAQEIEGIKQKPVQVVEEINSGVQGVIGQSHMQFIMPGAITRRILPLPATHALFREETRTINSRIDQLGLLQLTSLKAYVYHMGNHLDENILAEIRQMGLDEILQKQPVERSSEKSAEIKPAKRFGFWLIKNLSKWSMLRKMFQRSYNFLFEFYSMKK